MDKIIRMLASIGQDKWMHFALTAVIAAVVKCMVLYIIGWPTWSAVLFAAFISVLVGIGKEAYDRRNGGDPDWHDLVADVMGAIIGAV